VTAQMNGGLRLWPHARGGVDGEAAGGWFCLQAILQQDPTQEPEGLGHERARGQHTKNLSSGSTAST